MLSRHRRSLRWNAVPDQGDSVLRRRGCLRIEDAVRSRAKGSRMSLVASEGGSLWAVLASVPDHRRAEGKRYPLASLLRDDRRPDAARRRRQGRILWADGVGVSQFASEEAEHVRLLGEWIGRYPPADTNWDFDPDPPEMPE